MFHYENETQKPGLSMLTKAPRSRPALQCSRTGAAFVSQLLAAETICFPASAPPRQRPRRHRRLCQWCQDRGQAHAGGLPPERGGLRHHSRDSSTQGVSRAIVSPDQPSCTSKGSHRPRVQAARWRRSALHPWRCLLCWYAIGILAPAPQVCRRTHLSACSQATDARCKDRHREQRADRTVQ